MITINLADFGDLFDPCWGLGGQTEEEYSWGLFEAALVTKLQWTPGMGLGDIVRQFIECTPENASADAAFLLYSCFRWHRQDPRMLALKQHIEADFVPPALRSGLWDAMTYTSIAAPYWLRLANALDLHTFHIDAHGVFDSPPPGFNP